MSRDELPYCRPSLANLSFTSFLTGRRRAATDKDDSYACVGRQRFAYSVYQTVQFEKTPIKNEKFLIYVQNLNVSSSH